MKKIPKYPKKDGADRLVYVNYPVQLSDADIEAIKAKGFPVWPGTKAGNWVAAMVHVSGYSISPLALPQPDYETCKKGCDIHNNYWKFTPKQVLNIINTSMQNSAKNERMQESVQ